ncbi:MAG: sugar-transfer associated ATP-grasp domain-containing protein [Candidatus Omnitrophota bacterium]
MGDSILKRLLNWVLALRDHYVLNKKIKKIMRCQVHTLKTGKIDRSLRFAHLQKWRALSRRVNDRWLAVYSRISGIDSIDYVPEPIYCSVIEPRLNHRGLTSAYSDKCAYNLHFTPYSLFPQTALQNIDGVFYDSGYRPLELSDHHLGAILHPYDRVILKPSMDSSGGHNVRLFTRAKDNVFSDSVGHRLSLAYLKAEYSRNFLLQEYIEQHEFYRRFNPSSVNTVRVYTYRSVTDEAVIPLQAVLRIGRPGSIVDNQAAGGIACGIYPNARLNAFAVDKWGNRYSSIHSISFSDCDAVYLFERMLQCAKTLASRMVYSRLNGFDFCVDQRSTVRLLEINSKNIEINFLQMNTGPLFKEYTDEVIDYCLKSPKYVCLDFRI